MRVFYLNINHDDKVLDFKEKHKSHEGWINGGYFVLSKNIFKYLNNDENCVFENEAMENLSHEGQLMAYKYEGFWQCMDTKRDHEHLESLETSKKDFFKKL